MKTLTKILVFAVLLTTSFTVALANDCSGKKRFMLNEISSAISTYPKACRRQLIMVGCDVLFKEKLPQLRNLVATDDFRNLRKVVVEINKNPKQIADIIDKSYSGHMSSLIGDLNSYVGQCAR
jgi:hypothetical protein